jgi:2-polyprenyl-3-methyl-5-hydroxy-6-metoxy-1,4-benzoquinol methylase
MSNNYTSTHEGNKTLSIDGSGNLPSVDYRVAENICNFIEKNIIKEGKVIDFGSGVGYFQKFCEDNNKFEVWSVEGYSGINFVANKDRWLVKNLGVPLEKEYENQFNLVVSFECIEHIHQAEQETFWKNLFLCSNKALVTIHTENEEHDEHCFIRKLNWWKQFFTKNNWKFQILGTPESPWQVWPEANCSIAVLLEA